MAPILVWTVKPGQPIVAYRIVRSPDAVDALDSLRSNYERGRKPRGAELEAAVIHMGLSAFDALASARAQARRFPMLGAFIAELRLMHGYGFNLTPTSKHGHLTLWGDPIKLRRAIVAIHPIRR